MFVLFIVYICLNVINIGALTPPEKDVGVIVRNETSFLKPKDGGVYRIVLIGDSVTFGECATDPSTGNYPKLLEALINDTYKF